jgi:hypothetical protein
MSVILSFDTNSKHSDRTNINGTIILVKENVDFVRSIGFTAGKVTEHAFYLGNSIKSQLSHITLTQSLIVYILVNASVKKNNIKNEHDKTVDK